MNWKVKRFADGTYHIHDGVGYIGEFYTKKDADLVVRAVAQDSLYKDAQLCIRVMRNALRKLIAAYWSNKGTDCEFINCITPRTVPEYWREADRAVELYPHLGRK